MTTIDGTEVFKTGLVGRLPHHGNNCILWQIHDGVCIMWRQLKNICIELLHTYMFLHLFRMGVVSWWRILLITTWSWQSTICVQRIPITTRVVQITAEGLSSEMAPSLSNVSDTATIWVHWNMCRLKTDLYGLCRQMVFDKREYGYDFVKTVLSYQVELRCYSNPDIIR